MRQHAKPLRLAEGRPLRFTGLVRTFTQKRMSPQYNEFVCCGSENENKEKHEWKRGDAQTATKEQNATWKWMEGHVRFCCRALFLSALLATGHEFTRFVLKKKAKPRRWALTRLANSRLTKQGILFQRSLDETSKMVSIFQEQG